MIVKNTIEDFKENGIIEIEYTKEELEIINEMCNVIDSIIEPTLYFNYFDEELSCIVFNDVGDIFVSDYDLNYLREHTKDMLSQFELDDKLTVYEIYFGTVEIKNETIMICGVNLCPVDWKNELIKIRQEVRDSYWKNNKQ